MNTAFRSKYRVTCAGVTRTGLEERNLLTTMSPFWLSSGKWVAEFERRIRDFLGVKHCSAVNSGSSANLLAVTCLTSPLLKERRMKKGDEVITTALCFPTTITPIIQNGLIPVFVDVRDTDYTINTDLLEKAITPKTKAIIVAHTLGNPSDMAKIMELAKKYNLWVIEDNCDALGSRVGGKYTGGIGHMGTLSFYPAHHITTGEGGAVLTDSPILYKIINSFRDWGRDCWCDTGADDTCGHRHNLRFGELPVGYDHKYVFTHIGYNLKMTDMQAAIGVAQIEGLTDFIRRRQYNWSRITGLKINREISPFGVIVKCQNRDAARQLLERNGIQTRMLFAGNITKQPMMEGVEYRIYGELPVTDYVMNNVLWVGCHPGIKEEDSDYLCKLLKQL